MKGDMATLSVHFVPPSPVAGSTVADTISLYGNVSLDSGTFKKLVSVTVHFGNGGQSVKANISGVTWSCTGNASALAANGSSLQISASATVQYIPKGFPVSEPDAISGTGTLALILVAQPITTVLNLNGKWASGGVPGPAISVNDNSIAVDMSAYNRPLAHGTVTDSSDIMVTFPDDKGYTAKLQPPAGILWSNNSTWTKLDTLFSSSFDFTTAGAPPSTTQPVGTARVEGPPNCVTVANPPVATTLKWVRLLGGTTMADASLVGVLTETDGAGVYNFSAALFVPTGSDVCSISFETMNADEIMHIDFIPNNTVRIDDLVAFGSFVRDQVFNLQVTLNISDTQSTAHVGVSGGGATGAFDYNIPEFGGRFATQFGAIRLWKGSGDTGLFYGTSIAVTR
jgi:hypothetical protein